MWQAGGMILLRTGSKSCWVPPSLKGGMRIKRDRTNVSTNEANLRFSSEEEWLAVKYSMFKYTWRHWAYLRQVFRANKVQVSSRGGGRNRTKVVRVSQKPRDWWHSKSEYAELLGSEKTHPSQCLKNKNCSNSRWKGFARNVQYSYNDYLLRDCSMLFSLHILS